ncbi:MAG: 23S rRNA (cytidine(2498)-2'-O)-methyltransferase RlmM [Casimicrobiaceae bacterium]
MAHCRAGFEAECAEDLARLAGHAGAILTPLPGIPALARVALARFDVRRWRGALATHPPVFARALFTAAREVTLGRDRIGPIVAAAGTFAPFSAVWLETPDTNEGKTLSGLCRRLQPLLEHALVAAGMLDAAQASAPRLHVLFTAKNAALVGISTAGEARWPMGIVRLRMPHAAPSRSALKLAEAFVTFLGEDETIRVRAGMRAVDLGAAPGGWSWQLAYRGLRVSAVDNAMLKGEVTQDALVTHVRADGLRYRPRRPVDWLTCDIVEQPARIAALVADWIATGDARQAIFNLKLPMKRRYHAVDQCTAIIRERIARGGTGAQAKLVLRQLYHDREEVTGYLATG